MTKTSDRRSTQFIAAGVFISVFLLCGCRTTRSYTAETAAWQEQRRIAPYASDGVTYIGIAVTDFAWYRKSLKAWRNSRDLIGVAMQQWLGMSAGNQDLLDNPTRAELKEVLTKRIPELPEDQVIIIYLGTHQLKDGRVLLGNGEHVMADELRSWIGKSEHKKLFLADVCYAGLLKGPELGYDCVGVFAGGEKERTPEVRFKGIAAIPTVVEFFGSTRALIKDDLQIDHDRFSLLGLLFVKAIQQNLEDAVPLFMTEHLGQDILAQSEGLCSRVKKKSLPRVRTVNTELQLAKVGERTASKGQAFFSLAELMSKPEAKISIEDGLWLINQFYHPTVDRSAWDAELSKLVALLEPQMKGVTDPTKKVAIFGDAVFKTIRLAVAPDYLPGWESMDWLLKNRSGDRTSVSALYLILGERLGLPLSLVRVSGHRFIRYDDGKTRINVELTEKGDVKTDAEYRRSHPWESTKRADGFYLRSLKKSEALAFYLTEVSRLMRIYYLRHTDPLAAASLAVKHSPDDPDAWHVLGQVHGDLGRDDEAQKAFQQALAIDRERADTWNEMGNSEKDTHKQISYYQQAVRLKPDMFATWQKLTYLWEDLGNYKEAWACAQRCVPRSEYFMEENLEKLKRLAEQDE